MANTYSQLYTHVVFAVKGRRSLIDFSWESELYLYIIGIIQNRGHTAIAINGMPDHIHILFGIMPDKTVSELVREIKKSSNSFINRKGYSKEVFAWQVGFGAFSVDNRSVDRIANYIRNQKNHHNQISFKREYINLLEQYKIDFVDEYLFDFI